MALAKEMMGLGFSPAQALGMNGGYAAVTAAGSVIGDATEIGAGAAMVTGADGTKGVRLPATPGCDEVWIFNNSGSTLKVYPHAGAAISVAGTGTGSANASFAHTTYAAQLYKRFTSTQWVTIKSA